MAGHSMVCLFVYRKCLLFPQIPHDGTECLLSPNFASISFANCLERLSSLAEILIDKEFGVMLLYECRFPMPPSRLYDILHQL